MDKVILTILGAIVVMGIVVLCLASGRLLSGKNRLHRGSCGMIPRKDKKNDKDTKSCSICGIEEVCKREEKSDDSNSKGISH